VADEPLPKKYTTSFKSISQILLHPSLTPKKANSDRKRTPLHARHKTLLFEVYTLHKEDSLKPPGDKCELILI